jgi:RNA polymerase sigma factor (TIGR02999 family)
MTDPPRSEVTRLLLELSEAEQSDPLSSERLLKLVYAELRSTADALMRGERVNHTLQPTALVHEAYIRLVHQDQVEWTGRAHFLGIAARCMRQILVDHARVKNAAKRGGGQPMVTLTEGLLATSNEELQLLELDDALNKLSGLDERAARVAEMRLFAGMTVQEVAQALSVSARTVDGDWATARLWLRRELSGD